MAWGGSIMPTSFKVECLKGTHLFLAAGGDTFKIALYDNSITPAASDTVYNTTGELATAGGYTQGGVTLTGQVDAAASSTAGVVDWTTDPSWGASASFSAYGAKIYNSTKSSKLCAMLDFGGVKTVTSGTFTIVFPTADSSNAIIRFN